MKCPVWLEQITLWLRFVVNYIWIIFEMIAAVSLQTTLTHDSISVFETREFVDVLIRRWLAKITNIHMRPFCCNKTTKISLGHFKGFKRTSYGFIGTGYAFNNIFKGWEPSHIPAHKSLAAAASFRT